jgi:ArsR family transcriptional regulator
METAKMSRICKALAEPSRLEIVLLLSKGEKCGCELLEQLRISQPTLSHHMKVLGECGLVEVRKDAKWSRYSLKCEEWIAFRDSIEAIRLSCVRDDKGRCCWK